MFRGGANTRGRSKLSGRDDSGTYASNISENMFSRSRGRSSPYPRPYRRNERERDSHYTGVQRFNSVPTHVPWCSPSYNQHHQRFYPPFARSSHGQTFRERGSAWRRGYNEHNTSAPVLWHQLTGVRHDVRHSQLTSSTVKTLELKCSSATNRQLIISEVSGPSNPTHDKKTNKHKHGTRIESTDGEESTQKKLYWKKCYAEQMRQDTTKRFPNLLSETYFIPNDQFYKLKYRESDESANLPNDVHVLDKSQTSDLSCSRAELLVRLCLIHIGKCFRDPMVVLFNYSYDNYLNKASVIRQASNEQVFDDQSLFPCIKSSDTPQCPSEKSNDPQCAFEMSSYQRRPFEAPDKTQCPFTVRQLFPSPDDLEGAQSNGNLSDKAKQCKSRTRGDFDVLVISRKHGFVVMEIKSIGDQGVIPEKAVQVRDIPDSKIRERIEKAVQEQLQKSENLLRHLFSDLPEKVRIIKVLAVPCLKRSRLRSALEDKPDLLKLLCPRVHGSPSATLEAALDHCLCEEDIGFLHGVCKIDNAWSTEPSAQDPVVSWWKNVTKRETLNEDELQKNSDLFTEMISEDSYEQIISRFIGMYSTVEADVQIDKQRDFQRDEPRTLGECIHLTGVQFGNSILFPAQKTILNRDDRFLCLTGPPGSGKTLVLGLKALKWATAGHHVIIVCIKGVQYGTLVSLTLYRQVKHWAQHQAQDLSELVHIERLSLETDVKDFVQTLLRKHKGEALKFVIDEIPKEVTKDRYSKKLGFCVDSLNEVLLKMKTLSLSPNQSAKAPEESMNTTHTSSLQETPDDVQKNIEKALDFLGRRMKCFKVKETEEFLPVLDDEWKSRLNEIQILCAQVVERKSVFTARMTEAGILREIFTHLYSVLGSLYNLYTSCYLLIFHKLIEVLVKEGEEKKVDVSVWTSGLFPFQSPVFKMGELELCVRCPPTVQTLLELLDKEVNSEEKLTFIYHNLLGFHNPPLPSTGQQIKLLDHTDHVTRFTEVSDCPECGQALLTYLKETLHVGGSGPLQPHDVFICGSQVVSNGDCAFLKELKQTFSMRLECQELDSPPPYDGNIFVTGGSILQGLECKVVVYVPEIKYVLAGRGEELKDNDPTADLPDWLQHLGTWNRRQLWFVASRTLSHLIVFVCTCPRQ